MTCWGSPRPLESQKIITDETMSDFPEVRRSVQINATVTSKQRERFNRQARAAGMTNSQFMMALLDNKPVVTRKENYREELKKLIADFGRINSNLNMLSKYANTLKEDALAAPMLHRLHEIRDYVYQVTKDAERLQIRRGRPSA